MIAKRNFVAMMGLVVLVFFWSTQDAYAYVDPGTGTLLWQVLFASMVGSVFWVRKAWAFVRREAGKITQKRWGRGR